MPLQTLDSLLEAHAPDLSAVSIAKIDTAGSECEVLAGARHSLGQRLRPELMLISVGSAKSDACVGAFAAANSYRIHPLTLPHCEAAQARAQEARGGKPGSSCGVGRGKHVVLQRVDA